MKRALQTLVILALVLSAGCKIGKSTPTAAPTEAAPSATPANQSTGDFQLVGRAVHAFVGVGPGIDTSGSANASETPAPTQTTSATFASPPDRGVMRVLLDDASDSLKTNCGAARDETAIVYWTTDTQFDSSLLQSDLESSLEGRSVGVVGRIFTASGASDQFAETSASPSPSSSPGTTISSQCVLVADQIGTSSGTIPTAVPRLRTTRTPRPTLSPTASPTTKPTSTPVPTATPTATPTTTPTTT